MMKPEHFGFEIEVRMLSGQRQLIKRRCGSEAKVNFGTPVTGPYPKLYVIRSIEKPRKWYYIGQTGQSLQTRLRTGLNPPAISPYGYKWAKNLDNESVFRLDVLVFKQRFQSREQADRFIECVEAELVFLVRTETEEWPLYQNEIHFNNYDQELKGCTAIAIALYEAIERE